MRNEQNKKSLDTKMMSLMENQLNYEAILYKKYLNSANQIIDSELKRSFYEASEMHKENYLNILSYLKL